MSGRWNSKKTSGQTKQKAPAMKPAKGNEMETMIQSSMDVAALLDSPDYQVMSVSYLQNHSYYLSNRCPDLSRRREH